MNDANDCITSTEAMVIDGANGVCRGVRTNAGGPLGTEVALSLLLVLVAAWALRARLETAPRRWALGVLVGALAVPGLHALFFLRADRPATIYEHAAHIRALHDAVRSYAAERGCAVVVRDECVACRPIALLALIDRECSDPAPVELHEDALEAGCEVSSTRLVCGHASRPSGGRSPSRTR